MEEVINKDSDNNDNLTPTLRLIQSKGSSIKSVNSLSKTRKSARQEIEL